MKYIVLMEFIPGLDQIWVDYTKMIPVLTKAIQEQQCKIALLESCIGIV